MKAKTFTRDFFVEAGRRGGLTTFKRRGKRYMGKLGRKGGKASKRPQKVVPSEGIDLASEGV